MYNYTYNVFMQLLGYDQGRVIFGGQNIRGSAILRDFVCNIFVVAACTAGKVGNVASFMVRPLTTKTTNILPHENYPLYGI